VSWIVVNIHRIMLFSGVLTMTMVYAALAPDAALRSTFGESVSGPVADIVVRNWGALIALVGAMLIYGARKPAVRPMALTVAGASKAISSRWCQLETDRERPVVRLTEWVPDFSSLESVTWSWWT
jgi:hypothetical protein